MIDAFIRQNRAFAVYRLPGENQLHFTGQTKKTLQTLRSIESLNEQSGFVIAPFHVSESCPILLIEPEEESVLEIPEIVIASGKSENIRQAPPSGYKYRFYTFTQALADKAFEKLVLSHCIIIPRRTGFSPATVFYRACRQYINSYVYLFHTPQTGTWIGSTPEVLLSGKENKWRTVALAATQPLIDRKLPEFWDEKKREEQQLVADYIRNCLLSFDARPEEEGPYAAKAGELAHLRTDFRFSLPCNLKLGKLLNALHPTPAVCGLHREKAFRFILNNEGYDRRYYSGFIGRLHRDEQTDLYVNLRCMQIEANHLKLYAGGGLLASSDLQEEWMEIEDKIQTMFRIIE